MGSEMRARSDGIEGAGLNQRGAGRPQNHWPERNCARRAALGSETLGIKVAGFGGASQKGAAQSEKRLQLSKGHCLAARSRNS